VESAPFIWEMSVDVRPLKPRAARPAGSRRRLKTVRRGCASAPATSPKVHRRRGRAATCVRYDGRIGRWTGARRRGRRPRLAARATL